MNEDENEGMNETLFERLMEGTRQARQISRGETTSARTTVVTDSKFFEIKDNQLCIIDKSDLSYQICFTQDECGVLAEILNNMLTTNHEET